MESFESIQNPPPSSPQKNEGFLASMGQKARRFKRAMAFGAMLGAMGAEGVVEAKKPTAGHVEKGDNLQLTAASEWTKFFLIEAERDLGQLETSEDGEAWLNKYIGDFTSEYTFPTKGPTKDLGSGIKERVTTPDDDKQIGKTVAALRVLMDRVIAKTHPNQKWVDRFKADLEDVQRVHKDWSSYAARAQREAVNQEIERIRSERKR